MTLAGGPEPDFRRVCAALRQPSTTAAARPSAEEYDVGALAPSSTTAKG